MKYYATLIKGANYFISGAIFVHGVPKAVSKGLYDTLITFPNFSVGTFAEEEGVPGQIKQEVKVTTPVVTPPVEPTATPEDEEPVDPPAEEVVNDEPEVLQEDGNEDTRTPRQRLVDEAEKLHIDFTKNISTEKLKKLVEAAKTEV